MQPDKRFGVNFTSLPTDEQKWLVRFLKLAEHLSTWSKDPSTKCGAVIVAGRNDLVSAGYNGFAQGMKDDAELYANREVKYSRVVHCEINALIKAERSVAHCTLFTWPFVCCDRCAVVMIQARIRTFVFPELTPERAVRWGTSMAKSIAYIDEAKRTWVEVPTAALVTP